MPATKSLSVQLRPITLRRYTSYLLASLVAALIFTFLVTGDHVVLASVFLPVAVLVGLANFALNDAIDLPFLYFLTLSTATLLTGFVAHRMPLYLFNDPEQATTVHMTVIHFLVGFIFISDMEWVRLHMEKDDLTVVYPEILAPPFYYSETWQTTQDSTNFLNAIVRRWKPLLLDLSMCITYFLSNYSLNRSIIFALGTECTGNTAWTTMWGYHFLYMSSDLWPLITGFLLLRPVRLLSAFVLCWIVEALEVQVNHWVMPEVLKADLDRNPSGYA
jgi:hypothetical protein